MESLKPEGTVKRGGHYPLSSREWSQSCCPLSPKEGLTVGTGGKSSHRPFSSHALRVSHVPRVKEMGHNCRNSNLTFICLQWAPSVSIILKIKYLKHLRLGNIDR